MENQTEKSTEKGRANNQYSTFKVGHQIYALDVTQVQEIVKPMPLTKIPLVPKCVKGLINLRGQVTTAIGLNELLDLGETKENSECMNVVCKYDDKLVSLLVDEIGDVFTVEAGDFEQTPQTVSASIRSPLFLMT